MLVDRYPAMNLFALAPDLAIGFDPVLRELDRLLEDSALLQAIKADMARRSRRSLTAGRPGTPVESDAFERSGPLKLMIPRQRRGDIPDHIVQPPSMTRDE